MRGLTCAEHRFFSPRPLPVQVGDQADHATAAALTTLPITPPGAAAAPRLLSQPGADLRGGVLQAGDHPPAQRGDAVQPGRRLTGGVEPGDRLIQVDADPRHLVPGGVQRDQQLPVNSRRRADLVTLTGGGQRHLGDVPADGVPGAVGGVAHRGVLGGGVPKPHQAIPARPNVSGGQPSPGRGDAAAHQRALAATVASGRPGVVGGGSQRFLGHRSFHPFLLDSR